MNYEANEIGSAEQGDSMITERYHYSVKSYLERFYDCILGQITRTSFLCICACLCESSGCAAEVCEETE